jgi:ferrous iron transport protein B
MPSPIVDTGPERARVPNLHSPQVHAGHHHAHTELSSADPSKRKLVLVGNPNVGKSVFFNYLSGLYVDVSNFPGTTVEVAKASYLDFDLYDTPGIYGVSSFNDEETVARDIILNADLVVNIVDGVHLERDLFLTQQLIDMGKPVGVAVNMMDEARHQKLDIDLVALERELGVPVIGTVATQREGLDAIHDLIRAVREGRQNPSLHAELHRLLSVVGSQGEALLVLEGDPVIAARHGLKTVPSASRDELYVDRRNRVNTIVAQAVRHAHTGRRLSSLFGRATVSPIWGLPILAVILFLLYQFVGVLVAQDLVGFTETTVGNRIVEVAIKGAVARAAATDITVERVGAHDEITETRRFPFPEGTSANVTQWKEAQDFAAGHTTTWTFRYANPWIVVLFGEFGAITMTLTYLLFLLMPLVIGFYLALSVLEDSGYLPRLATIVDRTLRIIGLNGRAIIPLILGFGCVTMATITTRLLGTNREKTIATTILQLAIPCSAQLGVIAALLATAGPAATAIYAAVIFSFLVAVGTSMSRLIPGETSALLLDLPPMRFPRVGNVVQKTAYKTYFFMKEASPWFFVGALAVSILQVTGALVAVQDLLQPLVVTWLKLPKEAATAFVMGLVRRDFGAAGLYSMDLSPYQTVAALVTITLFVPCIASVVVMLKERGLKEGMIIWTGSFVLALVVGGLVAQILI